MAITSVIDVYAADGSPGCYLEDPPALFDALKGRKRGAGFKEHFDFMAAALIAGDLAMYETSPLRAPSGFQVVTGDCARVPQIDGIRRSHEFLVAGFGPMIRKLSAMNACEDDDFPNDESLRAFVLLQGGDPDAIEDDGPAVNQWLWMEVLIISLAAGWREGMTGTQKGAPRPPMCHYR